jgi:tRNA/rRNA methyltransferase
VKGLRFDSPEWYERIRFVLVRPSHPGNVGAAARALRVMGLKRLVVVEPRFSGVLAHADAIAFASGAVDLLASGQECRSLDEALADVSLAVAVSAEMRAFGPAPESPERIARRLEGELRESAVHQVALVFGPERTGLSIADVGLCQALLAIPTAPGYGSLNLAQAVQVVAFALSQQARSVPPAAAQDDLGRETVAGRAVHAPRYASQRQIADLHAHLEQALIDIAFVDPQHPKKLMPRLRRLFGRTRLEVEEVELLRGICTQMQKTARRER